MPLLNSLSAPLFLVAALLVSSTAGSADDASGALLREEPEPMDSERQVQLIDPTEANSPAEIIPERRPQAARCANMITVEYDKLCEYAAALTVDSGD